MMPLGSLDEMRYLFISKMIEVSNEGGAVSPVPGSSAMGMGGPGIMMGARLVKGVFLS